MVTKDSSGCIAQLSIIEDGSGDQWSLVDYVVYYYHPSSSVNMDLLAAGNPYSTNPRYQAAGSIDELSAALQNTPRRTSNVFLYLHGEPNRLVFYKGLYLYNNEIQGKIPSLSISGDIYLFVCEGATIAPEIASATGENVIATYQGVSFNAAGFARIGLAEDTVFSHYNYYHRGWWEFSPNGNQKRVSDIIMWFSE